MKRKGREISRGNKKTPLIRLENVVRTKTRLAVFLGLYTYASNKCKLRLLGWMTQVEAAIAKVVENKYIEYKS